jgi:hypothetical protein
LTRWMMELGDNQVQACEIKSCALHPYRPKPYGKPLDQAEQADSQAIGDLQWQDKGYKVVHLNQPLEVER